MLELYIASAIIGGGLVALSAFTGSDADADAEPGDADGGTDVDGTWVPILSMRFWTFSAAFFGLTGMLLHWLTGLSVVAQLAAALPFGLASGLGASWTLRRLQLDQITSSVGEQEMLGTEVRVLFDVSSSAPGKIAWKVRERDVELLAITDEEKPIARGETAVIIAFEDGKARVIRPDRFLPPGTEEGP